MLSRRNLFKTLCAGLVAAIIPYRAKSEDTVKLWNGQPIVFDCKCGGKPFCLQSIEDFKNGVGLYRFQCRKCFIRGTASDTIEHAAQLWNIMRKEEFIQKYICKND